MVDGGQRVCIVNSSTNGACYVESCSRGEGTRLVRETKIEPEDTQQAATLLVDDKLVRGVVGARKHGFDPRSENQRRAFRTVEAREISTGSRATITTETSAKSLEDIRPKLSASTESDLVLRNGEY